MNMQTRFMRICRRVVRHGASVASSIVALALATVMVSAIAADMPKLKPGLWEMTTLNAGTKDRPHKTTVCLDDSVQDQMLKMGLGFTRENCSKHDLKVEGNKIVSDNVCKVMGSTITSQATMTFSGSSYHTEAKATYDPPLFGNVKASTSVIDAKLTGPCKAGQQPGDVQLDNGQTINMKTFMGGK